METHRLDYYLKSDIEEANEKEQQLGFANPKELLHHFDQLLTQADQALTKLEHDEVLGSAILRGCQDLANMIGHVAENLEGQNDAERRALASACIQDAQLALSEEEQPTEEYVDLSNMSQEQVMTAIQAAGTLLRDIESSLRAIEEGEAQEIADVALIVAHLFIASLRSFQKTIERNQSQTRAGPTIEEIYEDEENADQQKAQSAILDTADAERHDDSHVERVRVLWPPLGPAVTSACSTWGQQVTNHPILAVALGLTLWPAAIVTAVMATPLLLADSVLQRLYDNFQNTTVMKGVEQTAAQVYHSARLSLLCGKLVARQTLRVATKQVERHGGLGQIAQDVGVMALDRATHPVETVQMTWQGVTWSIDKVREVMAQFQDNEKRQVVQDLQQ